ncbi:peptidase M24, structural domain-containing protein [Mortierella sp. GBAus27b]|nr:hypothetical protein BGX31_002982 [Mortierella sp. GBA43]KAI8348889.1 peptidase M24, structural domain-containing protein [Mortierella sp. GBAus27b]
MLGRAGLKYPSSLHCEKVASHLSTKARHDAIILAKGTETKKRDNTDNEVDFRQESNFFYLTGVLDPGFYFIYDLSRKCSYLIAPDPDPMKSIWKGPEPTDKDLLKKYDVNRVVRYSGFLRLLKKELQPKQIHGLNSPENGLSLGDKSLEQELQRYISERLVHPKPSLQLDEEADEESDEETDDEVSEELLAAKKKRQHRPHNHGPYGDHHGHRCGHHHHHHRHHRRHHHHHRDHCDPRKPREPKEPKEVTLFEALILARVHKTPIEIALSREATRITSDAHRAIMKYARPGLFEYQLEALFRYECARQGARTQAYLPIIGAGENAAYLHYTRNDATIKSGQLILVDAACEADCYGADVTRTFPVDGRFTPEQADIYNLVLEMQNTVLGRMTKGVEWSDMLALAQKVGVLGLKRIGILKGEDDALIKSNIIKIFFPHGLGHLLGLNTHDDGLGLNVQVPPKDIAQSLNNDEWPVRFHPINADASMTTEFVDLPPPSARRNKSMGSSIYAEPSTRLEPGMLVTVEPGIYFNTSQIQAASAIPSLAKFIVDDKLRRYMSVGGVRIEDVVLVQPNGCVENLTTVPKNLAEIERLVSEGLREYKELQQQGQTDLGQTKESKEQNASANTAQDVRGVKKRVGVFKKLLHAIRSFF